jgi:hypothetical protein
MNLLGSILKPELAINMLRKNLETYHGKKVTAFKIFFESTKDEIIFLVEDKSYCMEEKNLKAMVMSKARDVLNKGCTLTAILADCDQNKIDAKIYYLENNEKKFVNYKF